MPLWQKSLSSQSEIILWVTGSGRVDAGLQVPSRVVSPARDNWLKGKKKKTCKNFLNRGMLQQGKHNQTKQTSSFYNLYEGPYLVLVYTASQPTTKTQLNLSVLFSGLGGTSMELHGYVEHDYITMQIHA